MKKTVLSVIVSVGLMSTAQAHDGGHGPKLSDTGKYGGVVASVVAKADADKGAGAQATNKAELVRSSDTARLYIYDNMMKPADLKSFDAKASGVIWSGSKGKKKKTEFALEQKDGAYVGAMPKGVSAPYTVEVFFKAGSKDLLVAFSNLD